MNKVTVAIRTKNQEKALSFLLKNLCSRYKDDIDEILVLDNLSEDNTKQICLDSNVKYLSIDKFSYGGSANVLAKHAKNDIVVIFSAHSYPVSYDFFKLIKEKFQGRLEDLAGLRCLHNSGDFKKYINNVSTDVDPNGAGLIFAGSVFNRRVWKKYPFKDDIVTFEDKEWTKRVLSKGYKIEFVPAIFCYEIARDREQLFFRFKNELIGSYQLWGQEYFFKNVINGLGGAILRAFKNLVLDIVYACKRSLFMIKFLLNKPEKF